MKRSVFLCLIISLLVISLVYAADSGTSAVDSSNVGADTLKQTAADAGGNLKNIGANLTGKVGEGAEDLLEREVNIPSWLEIPAKILFGVESGVTWQKLIILLGVWIMFFIIIFDVMSFMPFMNRGVIKFLGAVVVTALASMTGALSQVATFFFDIAGFFKWTEKWEPLQIIIAIVIAIGLVVIAGFVTRKIKSKMLIEEAEIRGTEAGKGIDLSRKVLKETAEK